MADEAVLIVMIDGYLSGNRMAVTRSTVTANMFVTEVVKEQWPINFLAISRDELCDVTLWMLKGRQTKQTVKSENARLDMIKSGMLLRVSDLKTAIITKEFPKLPEMIARA